MSKPATRQKLENVTIEDAMEITGIGRFTVIMLLFCGFLMLGTILETLGFGYVLPGAQCDLHIHHDVYTWLAAVPFTGFILTSHAWGWVADKWGRRRALGISMSVGSAFSLLSTLSPSLTIFIALRFAASLFISGGAALGYAYLGEMCPRSGRDTVITLGNAAVASGTGVVPLLAWAILPLDFSLPLWDGVYRPWRLLITTFALTYLICSIICIWMPESPKFLSSVGKDDEAWKVLATMYSVNTGRGKEQFPVESLKSEMAEGAKDKSALRALWEQSVGIFKPPLLKYTLPTSVARLVSRSIITISGLFAIIVLSNGFYIWLPDVVNKVSSAVDNSSNSSTSVAMDFCSLLATTTVTKISTQNFEYTCDDSLRTEAFTVAIYVSLAVTLLTVASAFTAKYLGKRNLTLVFVSIVAASCAILLFISNPGVALVAFAGLQLGGSIIGFVNAFAVQIYPTNMRAMGVCMTMMFGRVGSIVATKAIGVLLVLSCSSAFLATLAFLAVMSAATLLLPKDELQSCCTKKISEENVSEL